MSAVGVTARLRLLEHQHSTPYEAPFFSVSLPGVNKTRPCLLVTSASHMPRALATFEKLGWNVTAYPVDYRTGTETPWTQYSLAKGASLWHMALHEHLGLLSYRVAGWL